MNTEIANTLGALIDRNARIFGDRIAITSDQVSLSFKDYRTRCWQIAEALRRQGVLHQDRVAFILGNSVDAICLFGAAELYGFVAVPLNWRLSTAEIQATIMDCGAGALVFNEPYAEIAAAVAEMAGRPRVLLSIGCDAPGTDPIDLGPTTTPPADDVACALPDDIAYLIYTSGSSGKPKGVMLDQKGQLASVRITATEMRLTALDRALITMPLFHVGAKLYQSAVNLCGGVAHIASRFDPAEALGLIEQHRLTVMPMVPTMVESLIDHPDAATRDLSSLRMILYTGAAMPGPVIRRGLDLLGPRFMQMYGQTENCGGASLYPHHHAIEGPRGDRILGSVGQAGMNSAIKIVNERYEPVPAGQPGEILLKSAAAMRGYWNNSIATAETLRDGWVCTGDLGQFDEEGFLFIVGRRKDMIISGGENIFAGEVEEALLSHPAVAQAAVIGVPDARWGEAVKAFVVLNVGRIVSGDGLIEHCAARIARYKKPKHIAFVDRLPTNPVGKVDKKALRALECPPHAG
jgi:acyl-CoA synthetase (AMP-forming)/AMP-acid ligase II